MCWYLPSRAILAENLCANCSASRPGDSLSPTCRIGRPTAPSLAIACSSAKSSAPLCATAAREVSARPSARPCAPGGQASRDAGHAPPELPANSSPYSSRSRTKDRACGRDGRGADLVRVVLLDERVGRLHLVGLADRRRRQVLPRAQEVRPEQGVGREHGAPKQKQVNGPRGRQLMWSRSPWRSPRRRPTGPACCTACTRPGWRPARGCAG